MKASRSRSLAGLLALVFLAACGGRNDRALSGSWAARGSVGAYVGVVFGSADAALWITERIPGVHDTTAIRFRVDTTSTPAQLDLAGFTEGPLAGMVFYGIFERAGPDTLRFDYRAAIPGQTAARPDSFTTETLVFTRTP